MSVDKQTAGRIRNFALAITILVVAAATLSPEPDGLTPAADTSNRLYTLLQDLGLAGSYGAPHFEFLANIAMFIPVGILIGLTIKNRAIRIALPTVLSVGIETFQYLLLPNRGPQLEDIVSNTLGGWIGLVLVALAAKLIVYFQEANKHRRGSRNPQERDADRRRESQATDALGWGFAVFFSALVMFQFRPRLLPWQALAALTILLIVLHLLVGWYLHLYTQPQLGIRYENWALVAVTTGVGIIGWVITLFLGGVLSVPRSLMLAATPVAVLTLLAVRQLAPVQDPSKRV